MAENTPHPPAECLSAGRHSSSSGWQLTRQGLLRVLVTESWRAVWLIVGLAWLGLAWTDGLDIKARQFACSGAWLDSECGLMMQIGNRPEFKSH